MSIFEISMPSACISCCYFNIKEELKKLHVRIWKCCAMKDLMCEEHDVFSMTRKLTLTKFKWQQWGTETNPDLSAWLGPLCSTMLDWNVQVGKIVLCNTKLHTFSSIHCRLKYFRQNHFNDNLFTSNLCKFKITMQRGSISGKSQCYQQTKCKMDTIGSSLTALSPRAVLILSLTLKAFSASAKKKKRAVYDKICQNRAQ